MVVLAQRNVLVGLLATFQNVAYMHEEPRLVPLADVVDLVRLDLTVFDHFTGHYHGFIESIEQSFHVLVLLRISASTFKFVDNVL